MVWDFDVDTFLQMWMDFHQIEKQTTLEDK